MLSLCFFIEHVVKLPFCDVLDLCLLYCYLWEFGKDLIKEITHSVFYVATLLLLFSDFHEIY